MYITYRTDFGKLSQIYHIRARRYGYRPGHQEQKEKETLSRKKLHDFLNTRIHSITPDPHMEDDMGATVNIITEENLDLLYRSTMKHAQFLDVKLPYHPTDETSVKEKIYLLYNALDSIVPYHVNLEPAGDRLQFYIHRLHK